MSVLIKGMEMPNSCYDCRLRKRIGMEIHCPIVHTSFRISEPDALFYRMKNCPLIPVPPHDDLIERNYLLDHVEMVSEDGLDDDYLPYSVIQCAPTIIKKDMGG